MNIEDRYKQINNALLLWKFDEACSLHNSLLQHSFKYLSEYIKLLADFGKLDKIYDLLDKYGFIFIEEQKHDLQQKHPEVIDFCLRFIKEKFIPSQYSPVLLDKTSMLLHLSFNKDKKILFNYIKDNANNLINKSSSPQDNMVLNHAFNQLLDSKLVNCDLCIKLSQSLVENPHVNNMRKKYIISKIINFSIVNGYGPFFKMRDQYYNHIQKISHLLHKNIHETGAIETYSKFNNSILKYNTHNLIKNKKHKPKVAVCISGMFRGNDLAIKSIYKNIVSTLDADVFVHSWDVWQPWSGICGAGLDSWTWRLFGDDGRKHCPEQLKSFSNFKKVFPSTANVIENPIYDRFTADFMLSIIKPTSFLIENEDVFLNSLDDKNNFMTRDSYNQTKMFYGIYKSTQLMMRHEIENNINYDFVIRARPDCAVVDKLTFELLSTLKDNDIAVDMAADVGPIDQFYISRRDTYITLSSLWQHSISANKLSPFESFPKYDAHALMYLWMLKNKIVPVKPLIRRDFSLVNSKTTPPEILNDTLAHDFKHSASHLLSDNETSRFIQYILRAGE